MISDSVVEFVRSAKFVYVLAFMGIPLSLMAWYIDKHNMLPIWGHAAFQ